MKQLNAEESFAYEYGRLPDEFPREYREYYKSGFKKGEENQKTRNRETESFDEWKKGKFPMIGGWHEAIAEMAWQACKKSHGLD